MADVLLDLAGCLPGETLAAYALTRMLAMRWVGGYWAARMGFVTAITAFRSWIAPVPLMLLGIVAYVVVPVGFSRGSVVKRVTAGALTYVAVLLAEVAALIPWFALTGLPGGDNALAWSHLPAFVASHATQLLVLLGLLGGLELAIRRVFGSHDTDRTALFYLVVPLMQIPLLFGVLGFRQYLLPEVASLYMGSYGLALLCALCDAALFWSLARSRDRMLHDQRACLLADELADSLRSYGEVGERLAAAARARHDFRNQAQVVRTLAAEGQFAQARSHMAALRASLPPVPETGCRPAIQEASRA